MSADPAQASNADAGAVTPDPFVGIDGLQSAAPPYAPGRTTLVRRPSFAEARELQFADTVGMSNQPGRRPGDDLGIPQALSMSTLSLAPTQMAALPRDLHRSIPLPKPFKGDSNDVQRFTNDIWSQAALRGISPEQWVAWASTLMEGTAKTWHTGLLIRRQCPATWPELVELLDAEFGDPDRERKARLRLQNLRHTGSVRDFKTRFQAICLELPDLTEREKVFQFTTQLNGTARYHVELLRPRTLAQAFQAAELGELASQRSGAGAPSSQAPFQRAARNGGFAGRSRTAPNMMNAMELSALLEEHRVELTQRQRERLQADSACYYCKQKNANHGIRNCPDKLAGKEPSPFPGTGQGAGNGRGRSRR